MTASIDLASFRDPSGFIVEFIPKSDCQVQRLLARREDIFRQYTRAEFEASFARRFDIVRRFEVADSQRVLYLMRGMRSRHEAVASEQEHHRLAACCAGSQA